MRVERVYEWTVGAEFAERDPAALDPEIQVDDTVRFAHISDTHIGKGEPGDRERETRLWLELFESLGCRAVLHSGDLVEEPGDDEAIDWAFSLMDNLSIPVWGVPGNHDVKTPGESSEVVRRWGPFPRIETVGKLQVVLVDSMAWPAPQDRSDLERAAAKQVGFFTAGGVGPQQREQLTACMDEPWDGARIVVVHHHVRQAVPPKPWYEDHAELMVPLHDADQFLNAIRVRGANLLLHGHRHQYIPPFAPFEDLPILNAGGSTPNDWPKRARIVDIAEDGESMRIWELVRFK